MRAESSAGIEDFVGRLSELGELSSALDRAIGGVGQLVLLMGEPGIGKTRLVEEFAGSIVPGPFTVWGHAYEQEAPPYWPWVEVLRELLQRVELNSIEARLGPAAEELAVIAPEIGHLLGKPGIQRTTDYPERRFLMFDAVTRLLCAAASPDGLVVILEDLHWADQGSVLLLRHLSPQLGGAPLMVIATIRQTDVGKDGALRSTLDALAGPHTRRLVLGGLDLDEVRRFLDPTTSHRVDDELVQRVHARTGGNPLFLREVARLFDRTPEEWASEVPEGVAAVILRRLERLQPDSAMVLRLASVAGTDSNVELLKTLSRLGSDRLAGALGHATEAGLLAPPSDRSGRVRFAHSLMRDAIYRSLPATSRSRLHRRIALVLEREMGASGEERSPDLAAHWLAAGDRADLERGAACAARAARTALSLLAYEEAARLSHAALDAMARSGAGKAEQCEAWLTLARAEYLAGRVQDSAAACYEAAAQALGAGRPDLLGEAALVVRGVGHGDVARDVVDLCTTALSALPEEDSVLRSRLLGQLTVARYNAGQYDAAEEPSRAAMEMAERLKDPGALVMGLHARQMALSGPAGVTERLALGTRMIDLAAGTGETVDEMWGRLWRIDAMFQLGSMAALDAELEELARLVRRVPLPIARWQLARLRGARAQMAGRFEESERRAEEALAVGTALHAVEPLLWILDGELGRRNEERLATSRMFGESPGMEVAQADLGHLYLALGQIDEARERYERLRPSLRTLPVSHMWLAIMARASELAAAFDDTEMAGWIYERLLPLAPYCITGGAGTVACLGSVSWCLGVLAACLGRLGDADRHCRDAEAMNERMGARPYLAHVQCDHARVLLRRGGERDRAEALRLAEVSARTARALGMQPLLREATQLVAEIRAADREAIPLTPREREVAALIGRGMSNRHIATALYLSERTVEAHVRSALTKLGFTSRTQIATWAVGHGLLDQGEVRD